MSAKKTCTKDKVVDAARVLFYRNGYGGTSYADIADKAGLAKGNVQYYFKSKEQILKAVTEKRLHQYRQRTVAWDAEGKPPLEALECFIDMFVDNAQELSRYGCPMGTLSGELGKGEREQQMASRELFAFFLAWLQEQFAQILDPSSAKVHADHLMALAQGIAVVGHMYGDKAIIAEQAEIVRVWLQKV